MEKELLEKIELKGIKGLESAIIRGMKKAAPVAGKVRISVVIPGIDSFDNKVYDNKTLVEIQRALKVLTSSLEDGDGLEITEVNYDLYLHEDLDESDQDAKIKAIMGGHVIYESDKDIGDKLFPYIKNEVDKLKK